MDDRGEDLGSACLVIGESKGAFEQGFRSIIAPELRDCLTLSDGADFDTYISWLDPSTPRQCQRRDRQVLLKLVTAPLAVFDMDAKLREIDYLLGAREALARGVTLACSAAAPPNWAMALCTPTFIDFKAPDVKEKAAKALRGLMDPRQMQYGSDLQRARVVQVRPDDPLARLNVGEPALYKVRTGRNGAPTTKLGLKCGDIRDITDVDVWVNSENDRMQMARETDRSISATIRHLGANRFGLDSEMADDAIAVSLARAMGSRHRVPIGHTIVTATPEGTVLRERNNVSAIAHVATVRPAGPGRGFEPGHRVAHCVENALEEMANFAREHRDIRVRTVLFPLIGAGDAGGPPELAASQIVGSLVDYLERRNPAFDVIYLLAFKARDKAAIVNALLAYGCEP